MGRMLTGGLYLLFLCSGAAGLVYESIWSRYLGLFVGHTAYAQIIVMVIFLGGMSGGAMLAGTRSARIANPLFAYALVELVVGVIGLAFDGIYATVTGIAYRSLFPHLAGGAGLTLAKWSLAGLLILPQSVLLGTTFPLMSAGVLRITRKLPGRVLSLLYCANSLGGAIGVLLAGFWLIGLVGLPGTVTAAGMLNLVVAAGTLLAVGVARSTEPEDDDVAAPIENLATPLVEAAGRDRSLYTLLRLVALGTAVSSFVYEIAWIRMLSLVLGSATHSFELMLSAFVLGLALGAFWIRSRADGFADPMRSLGMVQWLMGLFALATLPVYVSSFAWTAGVLHAVARSQAGYLAFTIARYGICLAVMLPATLCAGMTLPLLIRILLGAGFGESAVGAVCAWNALGSIVGVILASLVLLPLIGLKWMLVGGALLDMELGALVLFAAAPARRPLAWGAALTALAVALLGQASARFSPLLLVSGVYRTGEVLGPGSFDMLVYRDGRTATVSAMRDPQNGEVAISTNGKPDASLEPEWFEQCDRVKTRRPIANDASTQTLAPLIALAHVPRARLGAVIGQGSGMWSHFLLASPTLERLVTIEIEPEMVRASRVFYPANRRVFDDPRSTFVIDDAKSYFAAADRRFDVILSEPSNPWVSGVAGLFTTEFYERVGGYLADGGVFGQWLHLYEMDDGLVLSVLAAIHRNFPSYRVYLTGGVDILILASKAPSLPVPDWSVLSWPQFENDLCAFVRLTPATLEATLVAERSTLAPLLDDYRGPNSDFFPVLDLGAERARFLHASAEGLRKLAGDRFAIAPALSGRRIGPIAERESPIAGIPRLHALSLGAALRSSDGGLVEDPDAARRQKRFRLQLWTQSLAAKEPPADWRLWTQTALEVEQDLNGGTAGTVSEEFFQRAYAFMDAHGAPPEAWDAVRFRHGVAVWNFDEALQAGDRLLPLAAKRIHWVPPDELRAGVVVGFLLRHEPAAARDMLDRLRAVGGSTDEVAVRLLYAATARPETLSRVQEESEGAAQVSRADGMPRPAEPARQTFRSRSAVTKAGDGGR
jgi:spermidine synthase